MRSSPLFLFPILLAACAPEPPPSAAARMDPGPALAVRVEAVPPLAPDGTAAPITQLVLAEPSGLDPGAVVLVEGEVSDAALRGFRDGAPPASTAARVVPAVAFMDASGAVVIAPTRALALAPHTLVLTATRTRIALSIRDRGAPRLTRTFPPPGAQGAARKALFCADAPLPPDVRALGRAPADSPTLVERGAFGDSAFERCITITAGSRNGALPVALYAGGEVIAALEPAPLGGDSPPPPLENASCDGVPLGPACATVDDDRVVFSPPPSANALLLARAGDGRGLGVASPFVVRGLAPSAETKVALRVVDLAGRIYDASVTVTTRAPRPHLVLNEVYARPFGPKPASQWVEIVNDGANDVALAGWSLEDAHGVYALPPATVPAGAFALLVNNGYAPGPLDVAPREDAILVRLAHLGKHGLSSAGVALALVAADGTSSSASPARKATAGKSLARIAPEALDGEASFREATPTPGAPNR